MDIFNVLSLIGGLALFLFGMNTMGDALEKKGSGQLKNVLSKMTDGKVKGFLLGAGVTSVIQSSSATTVMVVGFVNSGIMTLRQAINIIMGANVGTTITAWILSLTGIDSSNTLVEMLKPSSFTPVLALVGIALIMFSKKPKKKDTGTILMGFAVLMTGMELMSGAVSGLKDVPEFTHILTLFSNPVMGVLAGALLTAIIQSSSASVGILQALSSTGAITFGSAIPIIMGQNIGTCVTAMISSVGANKNAKRAAFVHLYFNIIGTVVLLTLFYILNAVIGFAFINESIDELGIAIVHTSFNILCTALLFPFTGFLEKLATMTIKDGKKKEEYAMLDERLLNTPAIAIERCKEVTKSMGELTKKGLFLSFELITKFDEKAAAKVREDENKADEYEDKLGTYLVKLSAESMTRKDSIRAAELLKMIGDIERISDHSVNLVESAEEMNDKKIAFSASARQELNTLIGAVREITDLAMMSFYEDDKEAASKVEALEEVVDSLKEELKKRHVARLQKGECTIELGFVFQDIITNLERISDHCSNIAGCVSETSREELHIHEYLSELKQDEKSGFESMYKKYKEKYAI